MVKPIPTYFEATGNLASDAQTDVAPAVGGKIAQVNFDVGSYVRKGDVLLRLDARDAQIRLDQAVAGVEQQKKAVDQAIANLRQTQVRLGIKDGETFDIETFSQVKSVKAQLVLAEKELARTEKLLATGDVSRSAYDRAGREPMFSGSSMRPARTRRCRRAINTSQAASTAPGPP